MDHYWTVSEASCPEGPFTALTQAHATALGLSQALQEPVAVLAGPAIARWSLVEEVRYSELKGSAPLLY